MTYQQALERLKLKFTSGNSIPVERASITLEEFEALTASVVITRDCIGEIICVSRQDDEGRFLEVIGEKLSESEQYTHMREYWLTHETLLACKQEAGLIPSHVKEEYAGLDQLSELGAYHRSVEDSE